jgi:glucan phosphoethanolaminetransferase (alkaline phosphatase superfamily)
LAIEKRLLVKSIGFSLLITVLLMVIAYLPIWEIMNDSEKSVFPIYGFLSSMVVFFVLTAIFYFDIRRILERKSL